MKGKEEVALNSIRGDLCWALEKISSLEEWLSIGTDSLGKR